jgi:hypothetical protein
LFVADLFHPVNRFAVELFHDSDVRHGRGCRGAVPMLLTRREPDHVPGSNFFLGRASPALCQAAASRHDQGLAQRVAVPCCPSAGFERDTGVECACRSVCLKQGSMRTVPVKYSAGPLLEGCEPLLLMSISEFPSDLLGYSPKRSKRYDSSGLLRSATGPFFQVFRVTSPLYGDL